MEEPAKDEGKRPKKDKPDRVADELRALRWTGTLGLVAIGFYLYYGSVALEYEAKIGLAGLGLYAVAWVIVASFM